MTLQCNTTGGPSLNISWSFKGSVIMTNAGLGNILALVNILEIGECEQKCWWRLPV